MSNLPAFSEYAAAFEETLLDDDWSRLAQYFAEDSVYLPGDGSQAQGRTTVLAALKDSVDRLERKAKTRELVGAPDVTESGNRITLSFSIRYTKPGVDDLLLVGVEAIDYANGIIRRMEDTFEDPEGLMAWREKIK